MSAEIAIAHQDEHLLVVRKPSGLATTAPGQGDCLAARVPALDPKAPHLHPTSRLDAEVTGLVTFARTRRGNQALLAARKAGTYRRLYVGIAVGSLADEAGAWTASIAIDPKDRRRRIVAEAGAGLKQAETRFLVAARLDAALLLRLYPVTGRTHQLRVHAGHAGLPLAGDVHYGGPRRIVCADGRVVTARRVMLHCAGVRFPHPVSGRPVTVLAQVPDDMRHVWTAVGGTAADLELRDHDLEPGASVV